MARTSHRCSSIRAVEQKAQLQPTEIPGGEIGAVRRHLPLAVSLAGVLLARPLSGRVRHDERGVDHRERLHSGVSLHPIERVIESTSPARIDDRSVESDGDNSGLV